MGIDVLVCNSHITQRVRKIEAKMILLDLLRIKEGSRII